MPVSAQVCEIAIDVESIDPSIVPTGQSHPHHTTPHAGPTRKRPGYSLASLSAQQQTLGRSHRAPLCLARIRQAIELTKEVLGIPEDYLVALVPGGDTGAFEMAMWGLLGDARGVDVLAWDAFGQGWYDDAVQQLRLKDVRLFAAPYGALPDLGAVDAGSRDVCFVWNGTTSGVCLPNADWIPGGREGLTLCDATSACFAMPLPWVKLDVTTFSWQKALGGEGAHGMLVLSPRAVERLEVAAAFDPAVRARPIPKLLRLTDGRGKPLRSLFEGSTINTPSMLCVEDYVDALEWVRGEGGQEALSARSRASLHAVEAFVEGEAAVARSRGAEPWIQFLAKGHPSTRSHTSVCLELSLGPAAINRMAALLEAEGVAYDILAYRDAPPGLRIWTGPTVETQEVELLLPWIRWAYHHVAEGTF
jgi:phosphoserine aminotransferase